MPDLTKDPSTKLAVFSAISGNDVRPSEQLLLMKNFNMLYEMEKATIKSFINLLKEAGQSFVQRRLKVLAVPSGGAGKNNSHDSTELWRVCIN